MKTECDYESYVLDAGGEVVEGPLWCRLPEGHEGPHRTTPLACAGVNLSRLTEVGLAENEDAR